MADLRTLAKPRSSLAKTPSSFRDGAGQGRGETIGVVNAGSSSIKFALFRHDGDQHLLFRGQVENIGIAPRLTVENANGEQVAKNEWGAKELDHDSATRIILETAIALTGGKAVAAIGHRVVHGGTQFARSAAVTKEIVASLRALCP